MFAIPKLCGQTCETPGSVVKRKLFQIIFQKGIDISVCLWYNIDTVREVISLDANRECNKSLVVIRLTPNAQSNKSSPQKK
jgi:hypothetical protein